MRLLLVFLVLLYNILLKDGAAHLFPHNGAVYNYMAEVESGLKESAPHISKFKIRSSLHVQLDTSDPSHKNAYYFWMTDVKHEMYNGLETNNNATQEQSIPETSLAIQHPFLVIYNDDHSLQGLKFQNSESDWSRNMKKAIAAASQIDYSSINITDDFQRKSFFTNESTVRGICEISYDVRTLNYQPFSESNGILITKIHEPSRCQQFVQSEFNHVESFGCYIAREEDLVTSARKQVYLEKSDDVLFIKKLKTDESFYYFPWMHRSEMHYIQGSMSLELSKDALNSATPKVDFQSIPITSSIAIEERNVTEDNSSQSRHAVDQSGPIQKVLLLVFEIADYLEENHLDVNHTNFEHSQLLNKLLTNMYGLQLDSIEKVYEALLVSANKEDSARKIFLEMVPHVGTTASCLFIRNALTQANYTITYVEAIDMLVKLPSYVRQPTQELLLEMEILLLEDDYFPENLIDNYVEIRKAAILSFASLLYKTFKNSHDENIPVLENYLQYINEYLLGTDNNYEMKLVYIMALRNIQIGGIERFLIPIINGEVVIHERQEYSQLAASFAVAQAINHDKELVHTVFWPILSNTTNSRQFRIVAYDILMSQMSDVTRAMNIHRLMTREQDMHLYNYHYTTIKSLAHLADPCLRPVTELARKIWRLTKHRDVQGSLSGSYVIDYVDSKYGYGETFKLALNVDDETLWPNMGIFEYYHSIGRRSSPDWGVYWNTNMFSNMINGIKHFIGKKKEAISNKSIIEFLDKIKSDDQLSQKQNGHFELCQIYGGKIVKLHAIAIAEFKYETMFDAIDYILQKYIKVAENINLQSIWFKTLYEMNLLSETGFPIMFSNRLPIHQSSRIKVEFSVDQGNFNLKLKANNQFQGHGSYEMVVYNPIANVSHSVQRISAVDAAYPLEFEIFYSPEKQSFNMTFPKSMNFKNKGIRIHVSKYVSILGDENNSLKSHCPLCKNYEMVNQDLKNVINYQKSVFLKDIGLTYSQTIFSCEKNMAPILNYINILLEILKAQDPDFGYEPIYKVFTALSHKAFNEVISPDVGTCGNLILLTDEFDDNSQIELNINWGQITENLKKFYLRGSMNSVSFSNHSSFNFWNVNIDYYFDLAIDFTFTRKAIGQKNLVVCFKSKKLDSLDNYAFEIARTESQQCNTGEVIFNANIEGQCAFNYPLGIQYLKNSTFAKECTLNDEGLQSGKTYYIDISYSEVLEEISSVIYSLSETIRIFYLANTRYLDRYMKQRNMKITILFNLPETNGMNLFISTPFVTYEMQDLPIKYNSYIVPVGICKIFSKSALLRNNKTSSLKLLDWTLIASDYFDSNYAVFAKVIQNNSMAIQIYHGTHVLEIEPIAMGRVFKVTIDGVTQIDFNPRPGRFHDFVISFIEEEHYIDVELIGTPINIYFKRRVLAITASHSLKRSLGLCAEV